MFEDRSTREPNARATRAGPGSPHVESPGREWRAGPRQVLLSRVPAALGDGPAQLPPGRDRQAVRGRRGGGALAPGLDVVREEGGRDDRGGPTWAAAAVRAGLPRPPSSDAARSPAARTSSAEATRGGWTVESQQGGTAGDAPGRLLSYREPRPPRSSPLSLRRHDEVAQWSTASPRPLRCRAKWSRRHPRSRSGGKRGTSSFTTGDGRTDTSATVHQGVLLLPCSHRRSPACGR